MRWRDRSMKACACVPDVYVHLCASRGFQDVEEDTVGMNVGMHVVRQVVCCTEHRVGCSGAWCREKQLAGD